MAVGTAFPRHHRHWTHPVCFCAGQWSEQLTAYTKEEMMTLFDAVTGDPLELCVKIAAYYGLRRTCASLLLSQGISIKQIQI